MGAKTSAAPARTAGAAPAERTGSTATWPALFDRAPAHAGQGAAFAGFAEDFAAGDVICHDIGETVSEAEHMQLTYLFRN